jgi:hypothetical protein
VRSCPGCDRAEWFFDVFDDTSAYVYSDIFEVVDTSTPDSEVRDSVLARIAKYKSHLWTKYEGTNVGIGDGWSFTVVKAEHGIKNVHVEFVVLDVDSLPIQHCTFDTSNGQGLSAVTVRDRLKELSRQVRAVNSYVEVKQPWVGTVIYEEE